jgi:hypothetical protein
MLANPDIVIEARRHNTGTAIGARRSRFRCLGDHPGEERRADDPPAHEAIFNRHFAPPLEVIVIDSGSTDGTIETTAPI